MAYAQPQLLLVGAASRLVMGCNHSGIGSCKADNPGLCPDGHPSISRDAAEW
jgi:hypothetical protein